MEISQFAFKLLLLFFPGIICVFTLDLLTIHYKREKTDFFLLAFVLGITSYFLYWGIIRLLCFIWPCAVSENVAFLATLTSSKVDFSYGEIAKVTIVAVVIGLILNVFSWEQWHLKIARKLNLTRKIGELDIWGHFFNREDIVWITIRDHKNDLIYDGWVQAFSDDSKEAELVLNDVSVYKNSTGQRLYQVGALYLSRNRNEISIECRTIPINEQVLWREKK